MANKGFNLTLRELRTYSCSIYDDATTLVRILKITNVLIIPVFPKSTWMTHYFL